MDSDLKLLVVEDDPVDAQAVREALEEPGLCRGVQTAPTLGEAKERVRQERYDAVLLDLGLPDAQGLDGVADLLATAPEVPIVVLSGNQDPELALRSVDMGAEDYIVKEQLCRMPVGRSLRYAIERHRRKARLFKDNDALWHELKTARADSETDPLTCVANRRGLERHIAQLAAAGVTRPVAALVMDLDRFKRFNDRYGHDVGDAVLRETVARMLAVLEPRDLLARVGGDEFVVVLERETRAAAESAGADLREQVCGRPFRWSGESLAISATLSLVEFVPGAGALRSILSLAHPLLGRGKSSGQGRLECAWESEPSPGPLAPATPRVFSPGARPLVSLKDGSVSGHLFGPGCGGLEAALHTDSQLPRWLEAIQAARQWQTRMDPGGWLHLDLEARLLPPGFAHELRRLFGAAERGRCVLYFHSDFDEYGLEAPAEDFRQLRALGFQTGVRGLGDGATKTENLLRMEPQWLRFCAGATLSLARFPEKRRALQRLCAMLAPLRAHWVAEDTGEEETLRGLRELGFEAYCQL